MAWWTEPFSLTAPIVPPPVRWMMKMGGTPEEKPAVYGKADILPDVPRITAPLLILHGEDDPQVPPTSRSCSRRR